MLKKKWWNAGSEFDPLTVKRSVEVLISKTGGKLTIVFLTRSLEWIEKLNKLSNV